MITSDQIETILVEIVTSKPYSLAGGEAEAMRAQLKKECDEIVAKGGVVDIPWEIPYVTKSEFGAGKSITASSVIWRKQP